MNQTPRKKTLKRIGRATLADWSFRHFQKCERPGGRHSVAVMPPNEDMWHHEKVSVIEDEDDDWINRLLDEAGAPE